MKRILTIGFIAASCIVIVASVFLFQKQKDTKDITPDTLEAKQYIELATQVLFDSIDLAIQHTTKALVLCEAKENTTDHSNKKYKELEAEAYKIRAQIYGIQGLKKESLEDYKKANLIFRILKNEEEEAITAVEIARILDLQRRIDEAQVYYNTAQNIGEKKRYKHVKANILAVKGEVSMKYADYTASEKHLGEAYQLYKELNLKEKQVQVKNLFAVLYFKKKNYEDAKTNFLEVIDYYQNKKNKYRLAAAYNYLGEIAKKENDFDDALHLYLHALNLRIQLNDDSGKAKSLLTIGDLYYNRKEYKKALNNFNDAYQISKDRKESLVYPSLCLGKVYFKLNIYTKVLFYLRQSEKLAILAKDDDNLYKIYDLFCSYYEKKNRYTKAIFYYKKKEVIKDRLFEISLEHKLEAKGANLRRAYFVNENEESIKHRKIYFQILGGAIFIAIILLIVLYVQIRRVRKKNRLLEETNIAISKADKLLYKEKTLLASLLDCIPDLIFYKHTDGKYMGCNPAFMALYQLREQDIIHKTDFEVFDVEYATELLEYESIALKKGTAISYEKWITANDNQRILLETHLTPFFDGEGCVIGLVGISRDITLKNNIAEELLKAKEKAERADKLKTAFLSNMSHEIRTPMNAIVGFSKMLNTPKLEDNARDEYVGYINAGCVNLQNLINDIIDVAKIESGDMKVVTHQVQLNPIFCELEQKFNAFKKEKKKEHIDLIMKIDAENDWIIKSEGYRFKQIISNLIENALKFTEKGAIKFGYSVSNNSSLCVFIEDTGIGIPESEIPHVFKHFGRLDENINTKKRGTGLGLSIAKGLAELLNGSIKVISEVGQGTIFKIKYDNIVITKLTNLKEEKAREVVIPSLSDWSDKTILIAEDEQLNFMLLKLMLKESGIKILHAKDGLKAVDLYMAHEHEIDIALLDIRMPGMLGYDVVKKIKNKSPQQIVIAQTAFALDDEKTEAIVCGFDNYITKPVSKIKLLDMLSYYFAMNKV